MTTPTPVKYSVLGSYLYIPIEYPIDTLTQPEIGKLFTEYCQSHNLTPTEGYTNITNIPSEILFRAMWDIEEDYERKYLNDIYLVFVRPTNV